MTRTLPWDEEEHGSSLIAGLLHAQAHRRDVPGSRPGTHDYNLVLPTGAVVALEITQEADGKVLAQRALEARLTWTSTSLKFDWMVKMREPFDVKALHGGSLASWHRSNWT